MHWFRRHPRGRPPHPDILTPAEWRVLEQVRDGCTNAEIAARTGLSFNTVKTHVASILAKAGVPDRRALAEWDGQPAEVAPVERSRGFSWPLLGWLGGGGVSTGAAIAGGGAAAVLFATYFALFAEQDTEGGTDTRIGAPHVVAVIDGQKVTREQWDVALALAPWFERFAEADDAGRQETEELLAVVRDTSDDAIALANLMLQHAPYAEAVARGIEPTAEEFEAFREQQEQAREAIERGETDASDEDVALIEGQRDAVRSVVGDERYERPYREEQLYRQLVIQQLFLEEEDRPPYANPLHFALARNANVELSSELAARVTVDQALVLLEAYEQYTLDEVQPDPPPGTPDTAATPAATPGAPAVHPPDTRTGEPLVDAVIDVVLAGDHEALVGMAQFEAIPCVLEPEFEYGPPPVCPEGVAEGTPLEVMVTVGCHSNVVTPEVLAQDSASLLASSEFSLYLVTDEVGDGPEFMHDAAEYLVIFHVDPSIGWAWGVVVGDGGVVGFIGNCSRGLGDYFDLFDVTEPHLLPPP